MIVKVVMKAMITKTVKIYDDGYDSYDKSHNDNVSDDEDSPYLLQSS